MYRQAPTFTDRIINSPPIYGQKQPAVGYNIPIRQVSMKNNVNGNITFNNLANVPLATGNVNSRVILTVPRVSISESSHENNT